MLHIMLVIKNRLLHVAWSRRVGGRTCSAIFEQASELGWHWQQICNADMSTIKDSKMPYKGKVSSVLVVESPNMIYSTKSNP